MNTSKTSLLLAITSLFYACNRRTATNDSDTTLKDTTQVQVEKPIENLDPIYEYDDEKSTAIRKREITGEALNPTNMVDILNRSNEKVHMEFVKIAHDTLFVKIPESMYLTQQMGTTGADAYMMTAVYTLTELKGIIYVHFDFEEGDHAAPGTYSREHYVERN